MVVDGTTYASDLIIYPDGRVEDKWWRKSGHHLKLADIGQVLAAKPDVVVVGTGVSGMMRLGTDVQEALADQGIELVAKRTPSAAETFNRLLDSSQQVAGCFHLTC
jgi:hypothetical protein